MGTKALRAAREASPWFNPRYFTIAHKDNSRHEQYEKYVKWCESIDVPPANEETYLRTVRGISELNYSHMVRP